MAAFGIPFWTLIYRSFFSGLPNELSEAARIDGASHSMTFFRIMLPLANPATVLALILVFIGAWSDFMLSLILLSNHEHLHDAAARRLLPGRVRDGQNAEVRRPPRSSRRCRRSSSTSSGTNGSSRAPSPAP